MNAQTITPGGRARNGARPKFSVLQKFNIMLTYLWRFGLGAAVCGPESVTSFLVSRSVGVRHICDPRETKHLPFFVAIPFKFQIIKV